MRKKLKLDLSIYTEWLLNRGASSTTTGIYASRVGAVISSCGASDCVTVEEVAASISPTSVEEHLRSLSLSSRSQTECAWKSFSAWVAESGVDLVDLGKRDGARKVQRGWCSAVKAVGDIHHPQASAVWELFRLHSKLDPALVLALRWRHVVLRGGSTLRDADYAELRDGPDVYPFRSPLVALRALWDHARGDYGVASPEQPLVAATRQGYDPISGPDLKAILLAGREGLIPRLLPDPVAEKQARTMPVFRPSS